MVGEARGNERKACLEPASGHLWLKAGDRRDWTGAKASSPKALPADLYLWSIGP